MDVAVDVSGPVGFSPLMSLLILEADPPHWTGTPIPNITLHTKSRDRLLPGLHQGRGLAWGSQASFVFLPDNCPGQLTWELTQCQQPWSSP